VYVSLPSANAVAVVDIVTGVVSRTLYVGEGPEGIELSSDANTLYAALDSTSSLGVYDLAADALSSFAIAPLGGATATWDVAETSPGILFVSTGSGYGQTFIVRVDVATRSAALVAQGADFEPGAMFGKDPSGQVLYVGSGYNDYPESLDKLDITQATAPDIATSPFGEVGGVAFSMAVSPAGDKLVAAYGQVIRANELTPDGSVGPGVSVYSTDGTKIYDAYDPDPLSIHIFDTHTLDEVGAIPTSCTFPSFGVPSPPTAIAALPNDSGWAVIEGNLLCIVREIQDTIFKGSFE
jgi:DNA-binding beta-propeller fold protein YncE